MSLMDNKIIMGFLEKPGDSQKTRCVWAGDDHYVPASQTGGSIMSSCIHAGVRSSNVIKAIQMLLVPASK